MIDHLDVSLVDTVLLAELDLMTTPIIAATPSAHHWSQEEIDVLLGLSPRGTIPSQVMRGSSR